MENPHHVTHCLRELVKTTETISPNLAVNEVLEIFKNDSSILAIPVADGSRFCGFISRKLLFYHHLGRPFALELYGKKPVSILLEKNCICMEPELDINNALARLLTVDPLLEADCFAVTEGERCIGIVSVSDLMMSISINQARLLDTLECLSTRITDEVRKAGEIQQALLPPPEFRFDKITVSGGITTSSEIGGDYFDYFPLGDDRLGLVVADVSGHGVQSGMVTTAAKASLHTLISMGIDTPAELLFGMNNAILATARQTLLMTCLVAVINPKERRLVIANAGHNFPYLYKSGTGSLEMVEDASGFPLGFEGNCRFQEYATTFDAGDTLFLYSDGIVECTDKGGEDFGYDRLEAFLKGHVTLPPDISRKLLLEAVEKFSGSRSFADDVTILIASSTL